jgi:hypothetical protein
MSAAAGSPIDIATGIIIAIIDMGPKPGNMPIKVPIRQPPITTTSILIENTVCRPMSNPSNISKTF